MQCGLKFTIIVDLHWTKHYDILRTLVHYILYKILTKRKPVIVLTDIYPLCLIVLYYKLVREIIFTETKIQTSLFCEGDKQIDRYPSNHKQRTN